MPDTAKETATTLTPTTQTPTTKAPPAAVKDGKTALKQTVKGMNYEEGAKALSPTGGETPKEEAGKTPTDEERKAAQLKTYQEALGDLLGGKLYEIVSKEVSPDKVIGYAGQAVDALIKAAVSEAGKADFLDADGQKAAAALVGVLGEILKEKADAYLASQPGKDLAGKISNYVGEHPWQVVSAVLLAAASAVVANITIPEIKQKFKIADGLETEVKAKLGKIREISMEAIALQMTYTKGLFKATAGVDYQKDGKTVGNVGVSYGDDKNKVSGDAKIDKDGLMTATVAAKGTKDKTTGEVSGTYDRDKGYSTDAKVTWGDKEYKVTGGAHYDFGTSSLKLSLGQEFQKDWGTASNTLLYQDGKFGTEDKAKIGNDKDYLSLSSSVLGDKSTYKVGGQKTLGATTLSGEFTSDSKDGEALTLGAKYSTKDLTAALNASFGEKSSTVGGSIEGKPTDKLSYKVDAQYSLIDKKFLSYGVAFGFKDEKEFEAFLIDYHRTTVGEIPQDQFKLTVEHTIGQLMLRGTGSATLKDGSFSSANTSLIGAYPLSNDWKLLGGASMGFGPDNKQGFTPQVGVQIRNVPVLVGYDTNSKAWSLTLTIPFGKKK